MKLHKRNKLLDVLSAIMLLMSEFMEMASLYPTLDKFNFLILFQDKSIGCGMRPNRTSKGFCSTKECSFEFA